MEIIIDYHEDSKRIDLMKATYPCECVVKRLETGDIVIKQKNKPTIAIEVKTVEDFINSMKNRRIQDEAIRMKKKYSYSYILIYGNWSDLISHFHKYTIAQKNSNIFKLTTKYRVPVFWVATDHEFITMIDQMIINIDKIDEPIEPPIVRGKNSNPFINVLIGIDGVGPKTAQKLLDVFYTPGGVFEASRNELESIPRLGKKTINEILRMQSLKEEYNGC